MSHPMQNRKRILRIREPASVVTLVLAMMLVLAVFATRSAQAQGPNTWTLGASLPVGAVEGAAMGVIGSNIYFAGGQGSTATEIYNTLTNTWSAGAPIPSGGDWGTGAVVNGILYFIGSGTEVLAYNPSTNTWTTGLASLPTARDSLSAVVDNGIIYIIGGYNGERDTTVESYNPATDTWTELAPMLVGKSLPGVGLLGTTIVAASGLGNSGWTGDTEGYNVATNTWTTLAADPNPRSNGCSGVIGGQLYFAGGVLNYSPVEVVESYNLATNSWTSLAPIPQATDYPGSAVVGGLLYCIGGADGVGYTQIYQPPVLPDLIESSVVVVASAPASGSSLAVTDTVMNQGSGSAAGTSTWFYLTRSATAQSGTYLGSRSVPSLAAGGSNTATTQLALPPGIGGTYYIAACANAGYSPIKESNTTNNCTSSAAMTVASADLDETAVSVTGSLVSGGVIQVTDTVSNLVGVAPVSTTWFYLATSATAQSGYYLGSRSVPSLAAPNSNTATTQLTLPTGIAGTYYIVACANAGYSPFTESNRTNNCLGSAAIAVASADLDETAVSVTGSLQPGGAIQVTDTVINLVGVAPVSSTWFYLATSATAQSGSYLGSRSVPSLAASASNAATTSLTIPTSANGTYYIVACANAGYSPFTESNRTNNCLGSAALAIIP
jgi:N-acetylneuraminic acid mutarotase